MRRTTLAGIVLSITAFTGAALVGCSSVDPISGTVTAKYIEDFTEHTLVMTADNGEIHHFTVTETQFNNTVINSRINTANLDQPSED